MVMHPKTRRALTITIPLFTALLFFGWIEALFKVNASTNIAQTGITVGFIFGLLNIYLWYMVLKHLVP